MPIMISRDQLIDNALQAQKQIMQAMHAAAEPAWLQRLKAGRFEDD